MQQYVIFKLQLLVLSFLQQTTEKYNSVRCSASLVSSQQSVTHQLCDVGHLSHVVQSVFSGLVQHDEAGCHDAQVPQRLHARFNVTVTVCCYNVSHEREFKKKKKLLLVLITSFRYVLGYKVICLVKQYFFFPFSIVHSIMCF